MRTLSHNKVHDLVDKTESNQRIYYFLSTHPTGVLATVDPAGNPHAVVIYFEIDRDFTITFTTKRYTKKSGNLTFNNHAMLLVYDEASQTTVQVDGLANMISDTDKIRSSFRNMQISAMETSVSGESPISKLDAGPYITYKLNPLGVRMANFVNPKPTSYEVFETVDFTP